MKRNVSEESDMSDLSDTEMEAIISTNTVSAQNNTKMTTSLIEGGLLDHSSSSSSSDDERPFTSISSGAHEEATRQRLETAHTAMSHLLTTFTPSQQHRYETFRRVGFPRPLVKKLIGRDWGQSGATNQGACVIVVAGVAKVFVGEVVEDARVVAEEWHNGQASRLLPSHYREAHRRMVNSGRTKGLWKRNPFL